VPYIKRAFWPTITSDLGCLLVVGNPYGEDSWRAFLVVTLCALVECLVGYFRGISGCLPCAPLLESLVEKKDSFTEKSEGKPELDTHDENCTAGR